MHSATNCPASPLKRSPFTGPSTPLNPSPYVPLAKSPSDRTPHAPHVPCTLDAPTGSSIFRVCPLKMDDTTTTTPPTAPIRMAAGAPTKGPGTVSATHPPAMPLASPVGQGLPNGAQHLTP